MSEKKPEEARTEPLAPTVEQGSGESDKVEADPSAQPEPTSSDTVNDNSTDSSNEETAGHGATPEEPDAGSTDGEAETGVSAAERAAEAEGNAGGLDFDTDLEMIELAAEESGLVEAESTNPHSAPPPVDPSSAPPLSADFSPKAGGAPSTSTEAASDSLLLEDLTLSSLIETTEPLAPRTRLGPDGRVEIIKHLGTRSKLNRYEASFRDDSGKSLPVELREGRIDEPSLLRLEEILGGVRYAMLPLLVASFEEGGRCFLALSKSEGQTLKSVLDSGLVPDQALSVVLQLAQVTRRLHSAGWALIGLSPADVCLGQPIRIASLDHATRIGQKSERALQIAGYSAPELAFGEPISGKEDVYTLGAILYQALSGKPLPETGIELENLAANVNTPGAPQLLGQALATDDERIGIEEFYTGMLALRQRLARAPLALEVASATTVGLNPTRPMNEDSCGYSVWTTTVAEEVSYRALLCVADGMGGMDAGEIASRAAVGTIMSAAANMINGERLDPVALVHRAAPAVFAAAEGRNTGTTATCVVICDGELTLGHIGDTRAYLFREGKLTQLTNDHSLVAAMVASGILTKEEVRGHPDSNKVLRSLGGQRELAPGYVDDLSASYGQPSLALQPQDWVVLVTDGVWGQVEDSRIAVILGEALDAPTVARVLVDLALRAGAPDNATAVVARVSRMMAS